jgi:hypothetical protein
MPRLVERVTYNVPSWEESFGLILLPPFGLLMAGFCLGWIVKGFRASAVAYLVAKIACEATEPAESP